MPAPISSTHAAQLLAALQYQGQSNDCGPFTTATVLNALQGSHIDAKTLAQQMDRPVWRGPLFLVRRVPNWATFPWGIVDVLRQHGLEAHWRIFTPQQRLLEGLSRGDILMPMIGAWQPLWAHVMTLVAWDPVRGWGFANTQYSHHNIHWVPDQTFQRQWRALAHLLVWARPRGSA
jgi:hypothetical protein